MNLKEAKFRLKVLQFVLENNLHPNNTEAIETGRNTFDVAEDIFRWSTTGETHFPASGPVEPVRVQAEALTGETEPLPDYPPGFNPEWTNFIDSDEWGKPIDPHDPKFYWLWRAMNRDYRPFMERIGRGDDNNTWIKKVYVGGATEDWYIK
jgi:hypothetical protein